VKLVLVDQGILAVDRRLQRPTRPARRLGGRRGRADERYGHQRGRAWVCLHRNHRTSVNENKPPYRGVLEHDRQVPGRSHDSSGHTSDHSSTRAVCVRRTDQQHPHQCTAVLADIDQSSTGSAAVARYLGHGALVASRRPSTFKSRRRFDLRRVETTEPARTSGQPERSAGRQPQPPAGRDRDLHRDRNRDLRRRTSGPSTRRVWVCMTAVHICE
jgi:hypothetical protein